jgi:hypothetical protein
MVVVPLIARALGRAHIPLQLRHTARPFHPFFSTTSLICKLAWFPTIKLSLQSQLASSLASTSTRMSNTDYADYEPRSHRTRDDRPRYRDDRDDNYPDNRSTHRPRYDDPPPYVESKLPPRETRRGPGSDLGDDPRGDKWAPPRSSAWRPDHDFVKDEGRPRSGSRDELGRQGPRSGSKDELGRQERDPRDIEPVRAGKPIRNTRNNGNDDPMQKIIMQDMETPRRGNFGDGDDGVIPSRHGGRGASDPDRRRGMGFDEPLPGSEGKRREREMLDEPDPQRRRPRERDAYDEPEPQRRREKNWDSHDELEPPRRREKNRDPYDKPEPIRRRNTERATERRHRDDRYDDHDDDPHPRRRHDGDRADDRGYRSDGRDHDRRDLDRRRGNGGYRSDERDSRRKRDDDYDSDRVVRRSDRYDKDDRRERERDRYDSDRDRDRREKKKKGLSFNAKDIDRYFEAGQKHYKTAKPFIDGLAKMFLDNKK